MDSFPACHVSLLEGKTQRKDSRHLRINVMMLMVLNFPDLFSLWPGLGIGRFFKQHFFFRLKMADWLEEKSAGFSCVAAECAFWLVG